MQNRQGMAKPAKTMADLEAAQDSSGEAHEDSDGTSRISDGAWKCGDVSTEACEAAQYCSDEACEDNDGT